MDNGTTYNCNGMHCKCMNVGGLCKNHHAQDHIVKEAPLGVKFDPIGVYMGKPISTMTRDELLEFARWAGKELWEYYKLKGHL